MSHYNEKARWALDYKRIPHTRRAPAPVLHVLVSKRLGGKGTFPILVVGDDTYTDSTDIIEALEEMQPEPRLYPSEPEHKARALELEDHYDRDLSMAVRRLI